MKVYFDTVGCRLNQSEIEKMAGQFRALGHTLVASSTEADLVVVNTCAVTASATSDSRQKIRQASRNGKTEIIVSGCWATLEPEAAAVLPNVKKVIPNQQKDELVVEALNLREELAIIDPLARQPLPGDRLRTRAFIKVQDGCDNYCTFCITRVARGKGRSVPVNEVLKDVGYALDGEAKEIVLTGVHMGSWGQDLAPQQNLRSLVESILVDTNVPRLRLSSLEPWDVDSDFLELFRNERLCNQLHLPLQSGCAATLRRMGRKTTPKDYRELVEAARSVSPDIAITTDIIAGFPGETDAEFEESLEFVKSIQFAAGHVFTFSSRPGTPAARFTDQVPFKDRKDRNHLLRQVLSISSRDYRKRFLGKEMKVLWESHSLDPVNGYFLEGLTPNYIRIRASSSVLLWNEYSNVRMEALDSEGIIGSIQTTSHRV